MIIWSRLHTVPSLHTFHPVPRYIRGLSLLLPPSAKALADSPPPARPPVRDAWLQVGTASKPRLSLLLADYEVLHDVPCLRNRVALPDSRTFI